MGRAAIQLQDEEYLRWTRPELATWLNDAVNAILLAKPSASTQTIVMPLQHGTWQQLPRTGTPTPLMLVSISRNILDGPPERRGGRIITPVDRALLDAQDPHWHEPSYVPFRREARHYVYDESNPLEFYVYPGNDGHGRVEAAISMRPAPIAADYSADLGLPEPYSVPLLDYVMYRALSKDDVAGNAGRSAAHYQQFATAIGLKIQVERATTPNARR